MWRVGLIAFFLVMFAALIASVVPFIDSIQSSTNFFWYLSRCSALVAYILLFINLFLGIGFKTRYFDRILERWRMLDLHQFTALLAMAFIGLHIFSLLGDAFFKFDLVELVLPGASPYRPVWVTLGVIGFYVLLVLTFSGFVRKFIGQTVWRFIHYAAFFMFFLILFHGIKSGTDTSAVWAQWLYLSTGSILIFLFLWRFLLPRSNTAKQSALKDIIVQILAGSFKDNPL